MSLVFFVTSQAPTTAYAQQYPENNKRIRIHITEKKKRKTSPRKQGEESIVKKKQKNMELEMDEKERKSS